MTVYNNFLVPRTLQEIQSDLKKWQTEITHLDQDIEGKQITPEECSHKTAYLEKMSGDFKLTNEDVVARLENATSVKEVGDKESLIKLQETIKKVIPIFEKVSKHCASAKIESLEKKLNGLSADEKKEGALRDLQRDLKILVFSPIFSHEKNRILGLVDQIEKALSVLDNDRIQYSSNLDLLKIVLQNAHKVNDLVELKEKIPSGLLASLKHIVFPKHYPQIHAYAHMDLFDGRFTVEQIVEGLKALRVKMTAPKEDPKMSSKEEAEDPVENSNNEFELKAKKNLNDLSAFKDIPDELIIRIMSFLRVNEICTCQLINKRFSRISLDNSLWREKFISCTGYFRDSGELSVKEQYKDMFLGGNMALKLSNVSFTTGAFFKNGSDRNSPVLSISCHTSLNGSKLSRLARLSTFGMPSPMFTLHTPQYTGMESHDCLVEYHNFESNTQMDIFFQAPSSNKAQLTPFDILFPDASRSLPKKVVSLGGSFLAVQFNRNFINVWNLNANNPAPIFTCGDCSDIWEEKSIPNSLWLCVDKGKSCLLIDFTTGKTLVSIPNEDKVVDVRMLSDGHCSVLNSIGNLEIWNTQNDTAQIVSKCNISNPQNTTIVEAPNGILFFNSDDTIQGLNYRTDSLIKFEISKNESINKFCLLPSGDVCSIIVNEESGRSTLVLLDKSTLKKKIEKSLIKVDPISINAISHRYVLIVSQNKVNSIQVLDLMKNEICAQCDIGESKGEIFHISPTKLLLLAKDLECIMINFDASKRAVLMETSETFLSIDRLETTQTQRLSSLSLQDITDVFSPIFDEIGLNSENVTKEVFFESLKKQANWHNIVRKQIKEYLMQTGIKNTDSETIEENRKVETLTLICEYVEDLTLFDSQVLL